MKNGLPSLLLAVFPSLVNLSNRYFQYRSILETDSSTISDGPEVKSVTITAPAY